MPQSLIALADRVDEHLLGLHKLLQEHCVGRLVDTRSLRGGSDPRCSWSTCWRGWQIARLRVPSVGRIMRVYKYGSSLIEVTSE